MIANKLYNEWLKINVELHNKLEKLNFLKKEKEKLIKEGENGLNDDLKKKINDNIKQYEALLHEINILKEKAKTLNDNI